MSFYSITDPVQREKTIRDYLAVKERIEKRTMDERLSNMNRYRDLESHYQPIIKSQREMQEDIVNHLHPIHESVNGQMRMIKQEQDDSSPLMNVFYNRLQQQDPTVDITFGIHFTHDDNIPKIGITPIRIDDDNIIIENNVYHGTPGLWSLITDKIP